MVALVVSAFAASPLPPIQADRTFTVLTASDPRALMQDAGERLGDWTLIVAGVPIDGASLLSLARTRPKDPLQQVVRETLRQPFDVEDLLLFLDDVLASGRRGAPFVVPPGRARAEGLLLHPQDVWEEQPRRYPERWIVAVDEPPPQRSFPPAADGDLLGPAWTMRYRSPEGEGAMLEALAEQRPDATFRDRVVSLVTQLRTQGADVVLNATVRYRERGYLMWGAYLLRGCADAACVQETVTQLEAINGTWVSVPIVWTHPEGWTATREAARRMADAYDVVYANEQGARHSKHYDGLAIDLAATGLPRKLDLAAPDGARRTFDLSHPDEARDLSLTPVLVNWIERHFAFEKVTDDYPHWNDVGG